MTTVTTITDQTFYTWQGATFAWNDGVLGGRTWATSTYRDYASNTSLTLVFWEVVKSVMGSLSRIYANFYSSVTLSEARVAGVGVNSEVDLVFSEARVMEMASFIDESIVFTERDIRNANAILFNGLFKNIAMTIAQMRNLSYAAPAGYTEFMTLYPGDYVYAESLVGVQVAGSTTSGQGGIIGLTLNVDVPDVDDKGEVTVTDTGDLPLTVPFNKTYTVAPQVTTQTIAGATAFYVDISNVTTSGFDVTLKELASPATLTTGTFKWQSKGY